MPQAREKEKEHTRKQMCKSFTGDEGRPFEIGFQERVSNHLKQLLLRVMVVSVEEKLRKTWQVRIRKTNNPEPL